MSISYKIILALGFTGQFFFSLRFLIQWISSERHKKSVIPEMFWYFSTAGSLLLLVYACLKKDIVFILGQSTGLIIYIRNLYLIHKSKSADSFAD
ncbi:MAG TPA: lipid-A-disaccharide synthase N-terminal domain-containing protein [Spirochaetota bacterium]